MDIEVITQIYVEKQEELLKMATDPADKKRITAAIDACNKAIKSYEDVDPIEMMKQLIKQFA